MQRLEAREVEAASSRGLTLEDPWSNGAVTKTSTRQPRNASEGGGNIRASNDENIANDDENVFQSAGREWLPFSTDSIVGYVGQTALLSIL